MANILIATLGESPVVITAMFKLLREQEGISPDKLIVLHPKEGPREQGFWMIYTALDGECEVESKALAFEDFYTESDSYTFLQELFQLLYAHEQSKDTVYLSLAGGRNNMSALMALAAPFYACVRELYHVLDKDPGQRNFKSAAALWHLGESNWKQALLHDLDDESLKLVKIPFDNSLRVSRIYIEKLLKRTPEELMALWTKHPDEADAQQFYITLLKPDTTDTILDVLLTKDALNDYKLIHGRDANLVKELAACFWKMRQATPLAHEDHIHGNIPGIVRGKTHPFHYYKHATLRIFYHTEPGDIANYPNTEEDVAKVIISGLTQHLRLGPNYEMPQAKLLASTADNERDWYPVDEILAEDDIRDSILIVPLGIAPMIATQIYTLLTRLKHKVQRVVLIYPSHASEILEGVSLLEKAFKHEKITCDPIPVRNLEDIESTDDCHIYQSKLEATILEMLKKYPDCKIELALSGGRKGMAALAIFAAQRTGLRYVYHTLIADRELDQRVENQTTIEELSRLTRTEYCERLFLRAYKNQEAQFRLFKVPVGPKVESKLVMIDIVFPFPRRLHQPRS